MSRRFGLLFLFFLVVAARLSAEDHLRDLQSAAAKANKAEWGHWGPDASKYSSWNSHSNRLIPVYTFGIDLKEVAGANSIYRNADGLARLYGQVPAGTLNPTAEYFDQTNVYRLQAQAAKAGKKYIVLIVFDGMDWQTTWAAAICKSARVAYREGRGTGLHFQDYRGAPTDFGFCVTSPHNDGTICDVDAQTIKNPGGVTRGGYDPRFGGLAPWATQVDAEYLLGRNRQQLHAYTDSASAATSLTAGIKTYNDAINVDAEGKQCSPIGQQLQSRGYAIGVVTSVPISHATPASAYANNVHRDDYQDLTRDLVGLPSVAHKAQPLSGVDVLIGGGWGEISQHDKLQGTNFVPGNRYLAAADLEAVDAARGGKYVVAQRQPGASGKSALAAAAKSAAEKGQRLLGFFGGAAGHLPFRTADGNYDPAANSVSSGAPRPMEKYPPADIEESPTLAEMTSAALTVLSRDNEGFWLMIEAGDVDWANHANNLDCSVGAVLCGDEAFRVVTEWAEANQCWDETAVIVTADHGHYLVLEKPELLVPPAGH